MYRCIKYVAFECRHNSARATTSRIHVTKMLYKGFQLKCKLLIFDIFSSLCRSMKKMTVCIYICLHKYFLKQKLLQNYISYQFYQAALVASCLSPLTDKACIKRSFVCTSESPTQTLIRTVWISYSVHKINRIVNKDKLGLFL